MGNGFRPCDNCVCQASGKRRWECKKWHLSTGGKCRVTPCIGCQQRLQARTVFNPFPYYGHRRLSVPKDAAPEREPTEPQQGSDLPITTTTPRSSSIQPLRLLKSSHRKAASPRSHRKATSPSRAYGGADSSKRRTSLSSPPPPPRSSSIQPLRLLKSSHRKA